MVVYIRDEKLLKINSLINTVFGLENSQLGNDMPCPKLVC